MKTDLSYPYDPDFPYLVISASHGVQAKFKNPSEAEAWQKLCGVTHGVVSTIREVPDPVEVIPEGAIYITWNDGLRPFYARRYDARWIFGGDLISEEALVRDYIGSNEVMELDMKKSPVEVPPSSPSYVTPGSTSGEARVAYGNSDRKNQSPPIIQGR